MIEIQDIIQFGFAGIALYMLYTIAFGHLMTIEKTLIEIKEILKSSV